MSHKKITVQITRGVKPDPETRQRHKQGYRLLIRLLRAKVTQPKEEAGS